ncbi:hypothetical protein IRP63_14800 (plasmid) [Clostridium botulinum]|nr:hypothetical protein [Clostridium botulinum]QPW59089.1 hypothetical protein IRP63_14800 [Clostridium botulinum]
MKTKLTDIQQLVVDICKGDVRQNFSKADGEEVLRQKYLTQWVENGIFILIKRINGKYLS